jgi:tRNA-dihydrouridine synthase A
LLARLDARLFGGAPAVEADVLAGFERYVAHELERGTPLRLMTRHLLGMRSGRDGGRRWRRELGELTDGRRGLDDLRALVRSFTAGAALAPA